MLTLMSPKGRYTLFLEDYQREALKTIKERDGVSESEQIRRALDEWHAKRGIKKTAKRSAQTPRKA
jgi:Arc/MetJ-type ribon-helix-helix transcriptional regulator